MRLIRYIIYVFSIAFILSNKGVRNFIGNCFEMRNIKKQSVIIDKEIEELKTEKEKLLDKNSDYLEKVARTEFNLAKPDEIEFRFTPPKKIEK